MSEHNMLHMASWNVNSLTVRLEQVLEWLVSTKTEVLALQETKVTDDKFPVQAFHDLGYQVVFSGQKSYNGVAIVSKYPIEEVMTDIPGLEDPQRRILIATIAGVRLINLYVPNGAAVGTDKYQYKLMWLEKVTQYLQSQLNVYPKVAVMGDFNIAPEDRDVHDPKEWEGCVLVSPLEREAFFKWIDLGLKDSFYQFPQDQIYSWWDYRAGGFRRNRGLRIDHILLSEPLRKHCLAYHIDVEPRRSERPSDHAPVRVTLSMHSE